ncbi:MAG TPA: twin-arginine translocation signal domain-containing protein, partial [Terriglobia bacterium]|nr:twin-arginine translocation signal domain-containing protein [Terriglobia bacterium]
MPNGAKKNGQKKSRRKFLKHAVIGVGALALPGAPQKLKAQEPGRSHISPDLETLQTSIDYPRVFTDSQRKMIAFPLGGVGAGSISLGGR